MVVVEASLAQQLARLLAPALPYLIGPDAAAGQEAAETMGRKIGKDTWQVAKEVWSKLEAWADKEPKVASTLKEVAYGDPLAKDALAIDLKILLDSMPGETVNEIRNIVTQAKSELRITTTDRGGVAIGRDAADNVIIADFHGREPE